jgi:23S rRNA pseudouridine1911/1915/1917 synthase
MARTYEFDVGTAETGLRLDRYLGRRLPASVSRMMIQRAIRSGLVAIAGRPVKAHSKLRAGDRVTATLAEVPAAPRDIPLAPQPIPLDVVYEDEALLVVNKPSGLVTHPAPGHWDGTLVNAILWHLDRTQDAGRRTQDDAPPRAGIVHRLDKDTSGLLLVAKTERARLALSRQLKARLIRRRYLAVVEGHVPLDTGTVDIPIGRHTTHRKQMTVRHLGGRRAVTHYRVLRRSDAGFRTQDSGRRIQDAGNEEMRPVSGVLHSQALRYTVVECALETGRTHQIRVHLAHVGHPVVGDVTYGKRTAATWRKLGVTRQLLHAYQLAFQHPSTGRPVAVTASMPEDLARWTGPAMVV